MQVTEFFISIESIILGFGIARLIHGASHIFSKDKSYILTSVIWFSIWLHILLSFWSDTNMIQLEKHLDFLWFCNRVIYYGVVFFMCDLLAPHDVENITSFEQHFKNIKQKYFLGWFFTAILMFSGIPYFWDTQVMDKESLLLFLYFGIIPITIFTIIGFLSNNKILIQISIYGMLLTQIFNSLGTFMQQRNFIS